MFKSRSQASSVLLLWVFCLGLSANMVAESAERITNPMKPPAFALNKFRQARLKLNGQGPVVKTTTTKPLTKTLKLSSILIGQNRKVAIIDDQTLVVGDRIGKYKLVAIFKDRVQMVSGNGKRTELKLENEITAIRKDAVESEL